MKVAAATVAAAMISAAENTIWDTGIVVIFHTGRRGLAASSSFSHEIFGAVVPERTSQPTRHYRDER